VPTKTVVLSLFAAGTLSWTPEQDYVLVEAAANKNCVLSYDPSLTTATIPDGVTDVVVFFLTTTIIRLASMRHPIIGGRKLFFTTSASTTQLVLVLEESAEV